MEEIKVGEYVRSELGSIGKVTKIEDDKFLYENKTLITWIGKVKKHSKNIIDLIELGDYVNGMIIDEFDDVEGNLYLGFPIYDDGLMNSISEFRPLETVEIKSIVTKEQFASMEYRLED